MFLFSNFILFYFIRRQSFMCMFNNMDKRTDERTDDRTDIQIKIVAILPTGNMDRR